jgi:hypothetical protein
MQETWKENPNQRKNGFKPPFNINEPNKNQQDWYSKDDSKKEDSLGKRGRPSIQCWG